MRYPNSSIEGLEAHKMMNRAVAIPALSEYRDDSDQIIGKSKVMQEVYKLIGQIAESDVTVLIRGESGTGKELVARAIYQHSAEKGSSLSGHQLRGHPGDTAGKRTFRV